MRHHEGASIVLALDPTTTSMDEYTETTLVRVAHGLPVLAGALDDAARLLAARFIDPANSENRLKRPATRTCLNCGAKFKSRLSVLVGSLHCSSECTADYARFTTEVLGLANALIKDARSES